MKILNRHNRTWATIITLLTITFGIFGYQACSQKTSTQKEESSSSTTDLQNLPEQDRQLISRASQVLSPIPKMVKDPTNPINGNKVHLGKMLYYDTRLSRSNTISCNSCHNMMTFGVDNNKTSMGHGWRLGPRNSPTVLNAAGQIAQFWDGRAEDVEDQATGPVMNPIEMGGTTANGHNLAVERIASIDEYQKRFKNAFPSDSNSVNLHNIAKAIGAFERTLMTPAPFDQYLKGHADAMTKQQKEGLQTFMDVGCTTCHSGSHVGGNMFQKFGLVQGPYWKYTGSEEHDAGRYAVTDNESDKYFFKVPTLRNVVHTYPYFHDGSVWNLDKAIKIMAQTQLGRDLDQQQVDQIRAFLTSLTGSLPDSTRTMPILPPSDPDTPKPDYSVSAK